MNLFYRFFTPFKVADDNYRDITATSANSPNSRSFSEV